MTAVNEELSIAVGFYNYADLRALESALASDLSDVRAESARILFIRTGRTPAYRTEKGERKVLEPTSDLRLGRIHHLLRDGRYFQVLDLVRGDDPLWSVPAGEALETWILDVTDGSFGR